MKRIITCICLVLCAIALAHAQVQTPEPQVKKTPTPREASYALGVAYGNMIKQTLSEFPKGDALETKRLLKGLEEVLKGKKSKLTAEEAQSIVIDYLETAKKELAEESKVRSQAFMAENKTKPGVQTTASGLQYTVLQEGSGPRPTVEDKVKVHYVGTLIDGTEFDSSYRRGEPVEFSPLQVIPGWTEGLCLMQKGSRIRLFIPAELAYGEQGAGNQIPPHSALIFEIELLDILPGEPIPEVGEEQPSTEEEEEVVVSVPELSETTKKIEYKKS